VVPDGRCEIARVLLEAGRHDEADTLWRGSERKYKRCCGAVPNDGELRAAA
jgi:hypothetical protein